MLVVKWWSIDLEVVGSIPADLPCFGNLELSNCTDKSKDHIGIIFFQTDQSTETEIILRSVDLDTTGLFRCEISGEAPLFQTAYREAIMAVVGELNYLIVLR